MMSLQSSGSLRVKRVLVVSLSNIGDVILTLPVVDALCAAWPGVELSLVIGPKAKSLFDGSAIREVIVYDKKMAWPARWAWLMRLRRQRFDLVVDLRNSMLPFVLNTRAFTWPVLSPSRVHMKAKHLARLTKVLQGVAPSPRAAVVLSAAQQGLIDQRVGGWREYVVVAPGAADHRKQWAGKNVMALVRYLKDRGHRVVLVGDEKDKDIASQIMAMSCEGVIDLCGRTTLIELAGVIERSALTLTNDSGIMHLASYLDKPVVALFGPTDPFFYGPWSSRCAVVRKGTDMAAITPDDVIREVDRLL